MTGWRGEANVASAVFVPIAIGLAFLITAVSKTYLHKKLAGEPVASESEKLEK